MLSTVNPKESTFVHCTKCCMGSPVRNAGFTILRTYLAVRSVNVGSVFPLVSLFPGSEPVGNGGGVGGT